MDYVLNPDIPIERYFEDVSRIPRESFHEEQISDYLVRFAEERGLRCDQDAIGNVIIWKPAAAGYEDAAPVILQAHTDMVCAKTPDTVHDFRTDPITFHVNQGIVHADGTSLGADDGWGVAYMLSILDDPALPHPPLECVFTVREEVDMGGAKALDMSKLAGKRMIGLDGDVDTETFVASFTSSSLNYRKQFRPEPYAGNAVRISLGDMNTNVYGGVGHSECGNSIKLLNRLLKIRIAEGSEIRIASFTGGLRENVVPETAEAVIGISGQDPREFENAIRIDYDVLNEEFEDDTFRGRMQVEAVPSPDSALSAADSENLIDLIYLAPNNMLQSGITTKQLNSIVNMGFLRYENGEMEYLGSCRARFESAAADAVRRGRTLAQLMGYSFESEHRYHAWPYNSTSRIRSTVNDAMREEYGTELTGSTCPGGLEIAIFVNRIEGLDAIELGVNHDNPHSVDESMELVSFHKMYRVVLSTLKSLTV